MQGQAHAQKPSALRACRPRRSPEKLRRQHHGPVIVTMITMRMMQVPIHQIIHVISVRHCGMSTVFSVDVPCFMAGAMM